MGRKGLTQADQELLWAARSQGLSEAELARRLGLSKRQVNHY